jgi:large subunit ribosomal protein L25
MKQVQIVAKTRTAKGKAESGRLRRTGFFPGVVYSAGKPGRDIQLNEHDFVLALRGHHGESLLVDLVVDGGAPEKALLKAMQHHPLNGRVLHADFYAISMDRKLTLSVPLELAGEPVGVTQGGGLLEHVLREIEIEALPGDLPEVVTLDVASLGLGHSVKVKDIPADPRYTVLTDGEIVVAVVAAPRIAEEPEAAPAEGGSAEPEVITAKKTDEGEAAESGKKEKK